MEDEDRDNWIWATLAEEEQDEYFSEKMKKLEQSCPFCNEDEICPGEHILLDIKNASDKDLEDEGLMRINRLNIDINKAFDNFIYEKQTVLIDYYWPSDQERLNLIKEAFFAGFKAAKGKK